MWFHFPAAISVICDQIKVFWRISCRAKSDKLVQFPQGQLCYLVKNWKSTKGSFKKRVRQRDGGSQFEFRKVLVAFAWKGLVIAAYFNSVKLNKKIMIFFIILGQEVWRWSDYKSKPLISICCRRKETGFFVLFPGILLPNLAKFECGLAKI